MRNHWFWIGLLAVAFLLPGQISTAQAVELAQGKAKARAKEKTEGKAKEQGKAKEKTTPGVVAVFSLDGSITETPREEDFPFGSQGSESLYDLIARMKKARDDKQVKTVVLLVGNASFDIAQAEEIRRVIGEIKAAGKEVIAHADSLTLRTFALVSSATRVSVVPTGDVWTLGIHGESPYVRGLLDKLGVTPDFLHCGAYKSASEIFMRSGPSPEAEAMQNWLLDSLYNTLVDEIAKGRHVSAEKVRQWIDNAPYGAEKAEQLGMIDATEFRQDITAALKKKYGDMVKFDRKYGKKKGPELDFSSPLGIFKLWGEILQGPKKKTGKDGVAIVYVDGPILPGKATPSLFGDEQAAYSTTISRALDEAAADESVKAVVLRVDSPGGSAVASEIILNATRRVKAKKPFVVSMGGVAGSGGYYVACASDAIYADASTITASIGVVGGKFATTPMWNKIGVTWKSYDRGANAGMLSSDTAFTPGQREKLQGWMDEVYGVFKGHVTAIRGKRLKKPIDELAGGRVFTGKQALDLGLIDKIGTLEDAIACVAKEAKLKEGHDVRVIPRPKSFLEAIFEDPSDKEGDGRSVDLRAVAASARSANPLWEAAMPYLRGVEPDRVRAVKAALDRMALLQQEGVLLMMPEMMVGP